MPLHLIWRLFGANSPWPRRFLGGCARAVGFRAEVIGSPLGRPTLFVANHQSWADILLIGGATGASFVSKESVRHWPIAGRLATMVGTIYIAATDRSAAAEQAETIRAALHEGKSVAFFPEGRLDDGALLPFRPALFGAVVPADDSQAIMVQPVALDYGAETSQLIWKRGTDAGKNAIRLMRRRGTHPVTIRFLDPIDPQLHEHRREIAAMAESEIADALGCERPVEPA